MTGIAQWRSLPTSSLVGAVALSILCLRCAHQPETPAPRRFHNVIDVLEAGARCDGTSDDTSAVRRAIGIAAAQAAGVVQFPSGSGSCRITSTLSVGEAVTLACLSNPAQNNNSGAPCVIDHDFQGTLLSLDGAGLGNPGAGYGVRNLVLRQTHRSDDARGAGTAIRVTATTEASRATWVRIENVQIEEKAGAAPWTIGIDIDGAGTSGRNGVRDVWITNGRILSSATRGDPSGIRISGAQNVFVTNVLLNGPGGNLLCSGPPGNESDSLYVTQGGGGRFALDRCRNVSMMGGAWGEVTNTTNTSGQNLLFPSRVTLPFVNHSPSSTFLARVDATGALRVSGRVTLAPDASLGSVGADGTVVTLLGRGASGTPVIAPGGHGLAAGSASVRLTSPEGFLMAGKGVRFAELPAPIDGMLVYCTDCAAAARCAPGGTGALAKRLGGAWVCN